MAALVYVLLCLIWGSTWIAIKIGLSDAPPLYSSALRFVFADLVLLAVVLIRGQRLPTGWRRVFRVGFPGLFMFGIGYALVYLAEVHISSALTSVLFASFPFFIALFSLWILPDERIAFVGWLGLVIGFSGIVVISFDSLNLSGELFWGTMLGSAAPLASAYGTLIHKKRLGKEELLPTMAVQMAFGAILLTIAAVLFESPATITVSFASVGSILYLSLAGTLIAFTGYFWLLKRMKVVPLSLITFITPLAAVFIGVVLFDEPLRPAAIVGSILILSGVLLVNRTLKRT